MRIYVNVKFEAPSSEGDYYDPRDFLDVESEDDLRERVGEWAEEGKCLSAYPDDTDIAELWAAVQALKDENAEDEADESPEMQPALAHNIGHNGDG